MGTPVAASLAALLRGDATAPLLPLADDTLRAWAGVAGEALAQRVSLVDAHTVLGVGGGAADLLCALAAAQPRLRMQALVAPAELAAARDHIGMRALGGRVQAQV